MVPERGEVALELGSGLDSPRNSGGVGGWCAGRSLGGRCRSLLGMCRGEARCRSGGGGSSRFVGGGMRCLCDTGASESGIGLECGQTVSSKTRHRHLLSATFIKVSHLL